MPKATPPPSDSFPTRSSRPNNSGVSDKGRPLARKLTTTNTRQYLPLDDCDEGSDDDDVDPSLRGRPQHQQRGVLFDWQPQLQQQKHEMFQPTRLSALPVRFHSTRLSPLPMEDSSSNFATATSTLPCNRSLSSTSSTQSYSPVCHSPASTNSFIDEDLLELEGVCESEQQPLMSFANSSKTSMQMMSLPPLSELSTLFSSDNVDGLFSSPMPVAPGVEKTPQQEGQDGWQQSSYCAPSSSSFLASQGVCKDSEAKAFIIATPNDVRSVPDGILDGNSLASNTHELLDQFDDTTIMKLLSDPIFPSESSQEPVGTALPTPAVQISVADVDSGSASFRPKRLSSSYSTCSSSPSTPSSVFQPELAPQQYLKVYSHQVSRSESAPSSPFSSTSSSSSYPASPYQQPRSPRRNHRAVRELRKRTGGDRGKLPDSNSVAQCAGLEDLKKAAKELGLLYIVYDLFTKEHCKEGRVDLQIYQLRKGEALFKEDYSEETLFNVVRTDFVTFTRTDPSLTPEMKSLLSNLRRKLKSRCYSLFYNDSVQLKKSVDNCKKTAVLKGRIARYKQRIDLFKEVVESRRLEQLFLSEHPALRKRALESFPHLG